MKNRSHLIESITDLNKYFNLNATNCCQFENASSIKHFLTKVSLKSQAQWCSTPVYPFFVI